MLSNTAADIDAIDANGPFHAALLSKNNAARAYIVKEGKDN